MSWFAQMMNGLSSGAAHAQHERQRPAPIPSLLDMVAQPSRVASSETTSPRSLANPRIALLLRQLQPRAGTFPVGGITAAHSSARTVQPQVRLFDGAVHDDSGNARYVGNDSTLYGASEDAVVAVRHARRAFDYYQNTFGRSGVDGYGRGVDIVLNDQSRDAQGREMFRGNGGYYTTRDNQGNTSEAIRWGSGTSYQHQRGGWVDQRQMLYADDLTIHELTHGVLQAETGNVGGTADEAGSVHEAFADVMAASATRDWRIGEGMYTANSTYRYMRNVAAPDDARAVHSLWQSMDEYRAAEAAGTVDEHHASGILSHAAAVMQQQLGGERGWRAVEQIFYRTMDTGRLGDLSFNAAATGLRFSASELFGPTSAEQLALETALRQAGL